SRDWSSDVCSSDLAVTKQRSPTAERSRPKVAVGVELIVELRHLHQQGLSVSAISRRLHLDRKTVRKYLRQREAAGRPVRRTSKLDPFRPYLEYRLAQWPELSAARLCREIQAPPDPA